MWPCHSLYRETARVARMISLLDFLTARVTISNNRDRPSGPRLAYESVAEVLAAHVGLSVRLGCRPSLKHSSSPVRGRGVWPLDQCASAWISCQVCLTVFLFGSGDARASRDTVDLGWDAAGEETPHLSVDPPCQSLPRARLQVCCSSNCGLCVAGDCHRPHSMHLQCFSLLDRHIKHEPNRPLFGVKDLHMSRVYKAAVRPPCMSVFTH